MDVIYGNGFRFHHTYKENEKDCYFLTYALNNKKTKVLVTAALTVSQESLLDNDNYKKIFANEEIVKKLEQKYSSDYGLVITDTKISDELNNLIKANPKAENLVKLRTAFGIQVPAENSSGNENKTGGTENKTGSTENKTGGTENKTGSTENNNPSG